jgi:hypothetical protein
MRRYGHPRPRETLNPTLDWAKQFDDLVHIDSYAGLPLHSQVGPQRFGLWATSIGSG